MKKVKNITMLVKRVSYQEVVVSDLTHDVDLEDPNDILELCDDMRENPEAYCGCDENAWSSETTIESLKVNCEEL